MSRRSARAAAVFLAVWFSLALASRAAALDACKARIEPSSGLIQVAATKVGGPLLWRATPGLGGSPFFDPGCVRSAKASKCLLADPATVAAKTPPAACTIYLSDGAASCSAWVQGCVPGS